jgi:hypothetical protein
MRCDVIEGALSQWPRWLSGGCQAQVVIGADLRLADPAVPDGGHNMIQPLVELYHGGCVVALKVS